MEIGIDSFASAMYGTRNTLSRVDAMEQLLHRIELADHFIIVVRSFQIPIEYITLFINLVIRNQSNGPARYIFRFECKLLPRQWC